LKSSEDFFTKNRNKCPKYLALPNTENPRVIIPLNSRKHFKVGFNLHNTASPKNRLIKEIFKNIYPLPKLLIKNIVYETEEISRIRNFLKNELKNIKELSFSFYIGTPSINQKLTIQIMDVSGEVLGYLKVTNNEVSKNFILNEDKSSKYLTELNIENFIYPKISVISKIEKFTVLFHEDIAKETVPIDYKLTKELNNCLIELALKSKTVTKIENYLNILKETFLKTINTKIVSNEITDLFNTAFSKIEKKSFPLVFVHGDFVPYNIRIKDDILAIFDWEFSKRRGLPFSDLFHFIFQGSYQILNLSVKEIIENKIKYDKEVTTYLNLYAEALNIDKSLIEHFFVLYLVESLIFDLSNRSYQNIKENHFLNALEYLST